MKTRKWAIGAVFLSTLLAASGQVLIKIGTNRIGADILSDPGGIASIAAKVAPLAVGYGLYVTAAVVLVISLRAGELSVLYPIYAMNFIWVSLAIPVVFPDTDSMNFYKWLGILSIMGGVIMIGISGRGDSDG
jgi:multidrug transporter EmrE-like cation transporter